MIVLSIHDIIVFSAVSMETQKPVSPENDQFNVKQYISTFICQNILKKSIFEIIIVCCTNLCLAFLKSFTEVFLLLFKLHLKYKDTWKNACRTIFYITTERNKILNIWDNHGYHLSPLSKTSFTQYQLLKFIKLMDPKAWLGSTFWIKNRMSLSKLILDMTNNKFTFLCRF